MNGKHGHVAIIIEVTDTYIKIAQQNTGKGSQWNQLYYDAIEGVLEFNASNNMARFHQNLLYLYKEYGENL